MLIQNKTPSKILMGIRINSEVLSNDVYFFPIHCENFLWLASSVQDLL
jgi:hypothetical protein